MAFETGQAKLVDLRDITIKTEQSKQEKIYNYIKQIKNPYRFKIGDIVVNVSFDNENNTFQQKMESLLKNNTNIF